MNIALFAAFPQELMHILKDYILIEKPKERPFPITIRAHLSHTVITVVTGIGAANAESALNHVLEWYRPEAIVSIGFGGALYKNAGIGDLVWASRVFFVTENGMDTMELSDSADIIDKLSMRRGSIITLDHQMKKSELNKVLPPGLTFPVCDMETFPLARGSVQKGLHFFAIRSITDRAEEDIPLELFSVCDDSGRYRLSQASRLLFSKPKLIPDSIKFARRATRASKYLSHAVRSLLEIL